MKLKALCLNRSKHKILSNLSLSLPNPGLTALIGANGAGKSSLLRVLAGLSQASSGSINFAGLRHVFLLPEPASFYPQLTVNEQLSFVADLFGASANQVNQAINLWQLDEQHKKLTKHLSLGYRQRLSLAQLTVTDADLLLMDEPMNGMDPAVMDVFQQQINQWRKSKVILMATHIIHEAQAMADWVVVMHQGQVLYSAAYKGEDLNELYRNLLQDFNQSSTIKQTTNVI
ncbi:ABC transporter ATP-binding protein [Marinicella sp. S1101]|uniref:ABC transporter ATP-binding protein n=1 Tax=Marinicella marina TaxID=2996016 RepID=UPI002260B4DA|nr:ABC transporter ATP-binding protein [Marinicella marina]MCX7555202.1 ABC transporter ATP-binding protein [Marinicella marina]MDJ1140758.1 ABC transporter ATP-binding protein [Marinicella marina]